MPELRPLGENDRQQWLALRLALFPSDDPAELDAEISEYLTEPTLAAFGLFDGTGLIAFIEVGERPWGEGCQTAPVGWIEAIFVAPNHRRTGAGRMLVGAAENWARSRDYRELGSDADIGNTISLLSHAAWGFEETERLVMFRKRL